MSWAYLIFAGIFEILFAVTLKLSKGLTKPGWIALFVIFSLISFALLCKALEQIPLGTAYLIWSGIGIVGVVLIGMIYFDEPISFWRIFFIITATLSIVGLKIF